MNFKDLTIVDLDGTLIDYRNRAYRTFCIVAGVEVAKNYNFMAFVAARLSGLTNYEIYNSLNPAPIDVLSFDSQIVDTIESRELLELDVLYPDVIPWLTEISAISNLIICTSRKNRSNLEWQLSRLGLSRINYLRVPDSMEKGREVKLLLKNLNVEPSRIRFVGDTSHDMLSGNSIGADLYFVERGLNSRNTLDPFLNCSISGGLPLFND
jgi:phosphoglycolate phosphatase-like HAD superfamily hydrolase